MKRQWYGFNEGHTSSCSCDKCCADEALALARNAIKRLIEGVKVDTIWCPVCKEATWSKFARPAPHKIDCILDLALQSIPS